MVFLYTFAIFIIQQYEHFFLNFVQLQMKDTIIEWKEASNQILTW